jgi:hypothetical protein
MPLTKTETALRALRTALSGRANLPPEPRRNAVFDDVLDELAGLDGINGMLVLRDGNADPESIALGDGEGRFDLVHRAELEWIVAGPEGEDLEAAFDAGLVAIAAAIRADKTLGGTVDVAELRDPPDRDTLLAGARPAKTAHLPVTLQIQSPDPF